jgi:hypothetical protein
MAYLRDLQERVVELLRHAKPRDTLLEALATAPVGFGGGHRARVRRRGYAMPQPANRARSACNGAPGQSPLSGYRR